MLADLLFLRLDESASRTVIGMIQPNGLRWQAFAIYTSSEAPELRALGFYETPERAKQVVETEARATWRELRGAGVEDPCVVRDYEREAVTA